MKSIIQYNINFYSQYKDYNINREDIQVDATGNETIIFCGKGGNEFMNYSNRNIPVIYMNEISSESWIYNENKQNNIFKELEYFDINYLYNKITENNYVISPFRITIIPSEESFTLAPRLMFYQCLVGQIYNNGNDYVDISNTMENYSFLSKIDVGDQIIIDNIQYKCIDMTTSNFGKRIFIYPGIDKNLENKQVINISKNDSTAKQVTYLQNGQVKSNIKILFINDFSSEIEYNLDKVDKYDYLLINDDIYQKLYNVIPNKYIYINEDQDNINNKLSTHILLSPVNKNDNQISISNVKDIRVGDFLVAKQNDGTNIYEVTLKVKLKNNNSIFVDQNNSQDIPQNATIYRSYSYYFILFIYNNINISSINNNIGLKFEYV